MSKKKSLAENIAEIKERSRSQYASIALSTRLSELDASYKKIDSNNLEVLKYFPVAIVACIEAYFKMAIKEVVDKRKDLIRNATNLVNSNIKLDAEILISLDENELTLGDLIAHSCSYSKFENVLSSVSTIIGKQFANELVNVQDRFRHLYYDEPLKPILSDAEATFKNVKKIYELRHIICHEIASSHVFDYEEIKDAFEDCVQFLLASDEVIANTIEPNYPRTQAEMNERAIEDLMAVSEKLDNLSNEITKLLEPSQVFEFNKMQSEWLSFAEGWADFESGYYENGSLRSTTRNYTFVHMYEERIASLEKYKTFLVDI